MQGKISDISFDNRSRNREHNVFTPEYYGGADTNIYIDDKLCDSISSISFAIREQKKPIYSYASRIYDDIAHGSRIVQGVITVPIENKASFNRFLSKTSNNTNEIMIPKWLTNPKQSPITNSLDDNEHTDTITITKKKVYLTNDFQEYTIQTGNFKILCRDSDYIYIENSFTAGYLKRNEVSK